MGLIILVLFIPIPQRSQSIQNQFTPCLLVINVIIRQQERKIYGNTRIQYMKVSSFLVINVITRQQEKIRY